MAISAKPKVSKKNGITTSANSTAAEPFRARPNRLSDLILDNARANIPPPKAHFTPGVADIPSNESVNAD
jgi:hypothetical protein